MISQITSPSAALTFPDAPRPATAGLSPQVDKTAGVPAANEAVVQAASASINRFLQQNNLQFSVDADTQTNIVKVVDTETHEVIRQMPSQEVIAISKALDKFQGLLLQGAA